MLCWTARLVTLIARVYFVVKVVYVRYHCSWSPDAPRYYLCKQHRAEQLHLEMCCRVLHWRFRMRTPTPSMGQSSLGKTWPKTIGRTRTTPKPNLPGPECVLFLHLHADSALSGSGEHPGLMCWRCWMTSSLCGAPLKICWAPPGCCCWSYSIHRRSGMANRGALPAPTEVRERRKDSAPAGTCPICFSDRGCAGGYRKPISKPKESSCPLFDLFHVQTLGA